MQRIVGLAQFFFVKQPGRRIQPCPADFLRHIGRIKSRLNRLGLNLLDETHPQYAGPLHLRLMRIEFILDKRPGGFNDQALLFR